jgi:DNA-binding NarL/FixJ family response regulator
MRVVIAEDAVLLRAGVTRLLADEGIETVAAVDNGDDLLGALKEHRPDLAIVDVRMPPTFTDEGLRAALEIRRFEPAPAVLVLSQYVEETYASDLLTGGGGVGYLLKDRVSRLSDLSDALERVVAGGTVLDPEVVSALFAQRRRQDPLGTLSPREREVLGLMAEGRTNNAIGRELVVSQGAVEKHISSIFSKLGLPPSEDDHRRVMAVLTWLGV